MGGLIIGICGGSCSGKSTLVSGLVSKLEGVTIVHFDDFFVGKDKLPGTQVKSWEDPGLYRIDEYEKVLGILKIGKEIEIEANSREARKEGVTSRILKPNRYVIVEGFLIYYTEAARSVFDKKIYLDITEEEIVRRRYVRMESGGGTYSDEYIRKTLIEGQRQYVVPQKQYADLIIDATQSMESILDEVMSFIVK